MKAKQTLSLNTAWLLLLVCATLALVRCGNDKDKNKDKDEADVMQAKESLEIGYGDGDSADGVTKNVTLPTAGANEVTIAWTETSDNGNAIAIAETANEDGNLLGTITRPSDMHTVVTLTATLTKGGASDTREFMFTVLVDKLIDIESVAQLIAMRHDADGDGEVDDTSNQTAYEAAFPGLDTTIDWEGYELMADLDLLPAKNDDNNWTPQPSITATFAGNGYTISNMTIRGTDEAKWSFFAEIGSGGHVRGLALRDVDVRGTHNSGGFVGINNGTITGCSITGTITTANWYTGGLAGRNNGTITASYSEVIVSGGGNETGGLVGYNTGTITASYATGTVTAGGRSIGGLVGASTGTITASYATGNVTTNDRGDPGHHGGLVGKNEGGTIKASYATGNVDGKDHNGVGGLVGTNDSSGTITASYSTGTATSTGSDVGGLVGDNDGTVTNSYFDSTTSGITTGDEAKTTSELQMPTEYGTDSAIYSGWNIDVDSDGTTGFARGVDNGSMAGDTTADDPWDFGTPSQYPALKVDFDGDGTASVAEFGSQR